jgi:putative intracellular protease/amidase
MNVLIVLTSHAELGNTGVKTGFWLEEFASPYYRLKDAGLQLTLASPKGGQPPLDPKSDQADFHTDATRRFENDTAAQEKLATTVKLADMNAQDFDAVFYAGGHGPLWDLYNDSDSIALIETFIATGKPVAAVCHASAVLLKAKDQDGQPLVKGKQVTGFSNSEEAAVGLTDIVPYLLEDQLVAMGGIYQKVDDWNPLVITDGLVITGQNPASSDAVAEALFKAIS